MGEINYDCDTNCIICGEESNGYWFCPDCYSIYKDTDVTIKIAKCRKSEIVENKQNTEYDYDDDFDEYEYDNESDSIRTPCIICENDSFGYRFCPNCYSKYKSKNLILSINKCQDIEILEEKYSSPYKCKDGHFVKSKAEREIDNYLFNNNIKHCYEPALPIDENSLHDIYPDFYLPELNVYIEYWGYDENHPDYNKIKEYKIAIYEKLVKTDNITLICLNEKDDAIDIYSALERKLKYFKRNTINFNT